ncbi:autotransporter outer membrane beta-barrel domain-containing protein [Bradyrhizobium sp. STM 3809]|uniref:autotransporter outer membrane beta-barrel domain-containing protein n=1 Tax=Bradyrhizobium sp. STM 3809 TaxID=551936 RepID=UPI0002E9CEAF|nr:autotransporter outer membrane beta-barrel domain-containing protein [Bradyrhizobium sp. STM 3809]
MSFAGLAAFGGREAAAQGIFDTATTGPFTSSSFGEATYATGSSCFGSYVRSGGMSASGLAVGSAGKVCETPYISVNAVEVPIVWAPGGAGLDSGGVTELALPTARLNNFASGAATGIDSAGRTVVGVVLGADSTQTYYDIYPYIWQATTAGVFAGVTPTQLPLHGADTDGAAYGISPNGGYATGWSGTLQFDSAWPHRVTTSASTMQAAVWNLATNSVQLLGATPDPLNSPASSGKAVADNGTVVGWYGLFPRDAFTNDVNLARGSGLLLSDISGFGDYASIWQPKPFVWTLASGTMTQLGMTPLNNSSTTYAYGEARALNAGSGSVATASVAVGWLGNSASNFEAVRWSTTDNWATHSTLQLATVTPGDADNLGRIGAVANAVDASGNNVVGRVEYACTASSSGSCSQAVYWSVSADGQSSSGATLASILASLGVGTSNVTLTDATAIAVSAASSSSQILILGSGTRNDADSTQDLFLIKLDRVSASSPPTSGGITSVLEQRGSLGSLGVIANQGVIAADAAMGALATAADYYRCARTAGGDASPWCGFAYGLVAGNSGYGTSGTELSGTFGLARTLAPSTSIGFSIGVSGLRNGLAYGGRFDAPGATFGTYFAHRPDTGLQFLAMAVASLYPDLTLTRGYLNGTTLTNSQGATHASSAGAMARIGWAFAVPGLKATVTPYAQLSYVNARVGGFVENGGPFPASIAAFNVAATTLRVGTQLRGTLTERITAFGGLAWANNVRNDAPVVQGSLLAADCSGASPLTAFCGMTGLGPRLSRSWVEGQAGLRYQLAPGSAAMISANAASQNTLTYGLQVGYSRAF